jgi:acyl dehydratase
MPDPVPPQPVYLEDLSVGQRFTAAADAPVEAAAIKRFAAEFDPQPFHLDESAGGDTLLGGFAASGWHTAALTMRLIAAAGPKVAGGMIGAGVEIAWPQPTRPGDQLSIESEILEIRPSRSRPDRGIVVLRTETRNQRGEVLQVLTARMIVPRRATEGAQP